jgi:mannose-6-phosphate isomerase-like protein (cupin superfamily)
MLTTSRQVIVPKGWGFEKWITNGDSYCGKLLYIIKGKECSWHYHNVKDETFFIQSGRLRVTYGTHDDRTLAETIVLERGDSFHVPAGLRHQMHALEETELFEFSTHHAEIDSIRLLKGS